MKISDKIILIKPEELIPYHNNPKEHSTEQIDKIASSIKNFGFVQPIVIDGEKEVIIGHGRLAAAKKLDLKKVPVMVKDDLTPSQVRQLRLADNRVAESPWDEELLAVELEVLMEEGADLSLTGFEEDKINSILNLNSNEVEEDSFDYEGAESRAKSNTITLPGDIWLLGRHKLICGDSTSEEVYKNLFEDEKADLIITDPPYNVNYGDKANMLNKYQKGHRITDHIKNDNMEDADFAKFLFESYSCMYENIKEGGCIYVFHADTEGINFRTEFKNAGFKLHQVIVWCKNTLVIGRQDYQWKHEPILYGWKPGAGHYWNGGRKQTTVLQEAPGVRVEKVGEYYHITFDLGIHDVVIKVPEYELISGGTDAGKTTWFFDKPRSNSVHPTMKPVEILARAIKNSSKKDELVLDPFAGSGSTLIAAEQTGCRSYNIELDAVYCDVIVERYRNYKNNDSGIYLIRDGETSKYSDLKVKSKVI